MISSLFKGLAFWLLVLFSYTAHAQQWPNPYKPQCPAGFSLSNNQCVKAVPPSSLTCPSGWSLSGNQCTITTSSSVPAICPSSMGLPDKTSQCKTFNIKTRTWGGPFAMATCPTGYKLNSGLCVKSSSRSIPATIGPGSCSPGTKVGSQCIARVPDCMSRYVLRNNMCVPSK